MPIDSTSGIGGNNPSIDNNSDNSTAAADEKFKEVLNQVIDTIGADTARYLLKNNEDIMKDMQENE